MIAKKCYRVTNGIIVVIDADYEEFADLNDDDISIEFVEYGINIVIGDCVVPIPEIMFDYIIDNNNVTIYATNDDEYFFEPTLHIELPKDTLVEAKGVYKYWSMQKDTVAQQG